MREESDGERDITKPNCRVYKKEFIRKNWALNACVHAVFIGLVS